MLSRVISNPSSGSGVRVYWGRGAAADSIVRDRRRAGGVGRSGLVLRRTNPPVRCFCPGRLYLLYRRDDRRHPVLQPLRHQVHRWSGRDGTEGRVRRDDAPRRRRRHRGLSGLARQEPEVVRRLLRGTQQGWTRPWTPDRTRTAGILGRAVARPAFPLRAAGRGETERTSRTDLRLPRGGRVLFGTFECTPWYVRDGCPEDRVGDAFDPALRRIAAGDLVVDRRSSQAPATQARRSRQARLRPPLHGRLGARAKAPLWLQDRALARHRPGRQALRRRPR